MQQHHKWNQTCVVIVAIDYIGHFITAIIQSKVAI
jgi:hypothetical protein